MIFVNVIISVQEYCSNFELLLLAEDLNGLQSALFVLPLRKTI